MVSAAQAPLVRAPWHDAYDTQMALWRWYRTPDAMRWVRDNYRASTEGHEKDVVEMIGRMWDAEMGRLIDCDPVYVSDDMCELVDYARATFDPEPLLESDLLTPHGFMYYAHPIVMPDRYGNPLAIQAASWTRSDYSSPSPEAWAEARLRLGLDDEEAVRKLGPRVRTSEMQALIDEGLIEPLGIAVTLYANRDHYLDEMVPGREVPDWIRDCTRAVPVVPFHVTPWHFNETFDGNQIDPKGKETAADEWWRLVQTTFRLMQQRVAHKGIERLHRSHRREARRLGLEYEPEVVVVRLRREAGERPEPSGERANYSHRFIRRGHWRNQPYGPKGNPTLYRQIFIDPTVVGDPELPLILKPRRVFEWKR